MPLPCVRELWQPSSDREWKKQYQDDLESRKAKGRRGLTFRHLTMLRRSSLYGESLANHEQYDLAGELAEWVEKLDDLTTVLWIAFTVEGAGQAPEITRLFCN
jgi:hypothetical protein